MVPPHPTISLPLKQPQPLFFPLTPASSSVPPHQLQLCRLSHSHHPLSCPGSLGLTSVHPVALMTSEQSIVFTLKKRKHSFKCKPVYLCNSMVLQGNYTEKSHNLNVEGLSSDMKHTDTHWYCLFVSRICPSVDTFFK